MNLSGNLYTRHNIFNLSSIRFESSNSRNKDEDRILKFGLFDRVFGGVLRLDLITDLFLFYSIKIRFYT